MCHSEQSGRSASLSCRTGTLRRAQGDVTSKTRSGMDDRNIADILAAQADKLNQGRAARDAASFPVDRPEDSESLAQLMELAEKVQGALTPVEPNPVFVDRLSRQLPALMLEGSREVSRRARRATLVVAAALGSAVSLISAVGVIIYLLRHRGRRPQVQCPGES
jgi:hypothetical protein